MQRGLVALVAVVSACSAHINFAGLKPGPRRASFQDRILVRRLPNGLRVAVRPDTRADLVTVEVRYEVGGADDPTGNAGLAHYLEHVLWEAPLRGKTALSDAALDGNAMTGLDRTYFYATALDVDLPSELELAARRLELTCADLDDAALARERDVVVEEAKLRSSSGWDKDAIAAAIWGQNHPYAHGEGGVAFAAANKAQVCGFLDQHYGPASATLVVTGRVDDSVMDLIVDRFEKIPARVQAHREAFPAAQPSTSVVPVPGLEKPTVMMIFPVDPKGGGEDAAVAVLTGLVRRLDRSPVGSARMLSFGEERARVLVAYAEVDDAGRMSDVEAAMRDAFKIPGLLALDAVQRRVRAELVDHFDDLVSAGIQIADLLVRGQRLSRYTLLQQIDDLTEPQLVRLLDMSNARVVRLVPAGTKDSSHHVGEVATSLHDLDVSRVEAPDLTPPALPATRARRELIDYKLSNGVRVWLAPDPQAIAIDARLVIATGTVDDATMLPWQAATLLEGYNGYYEGDTDAIDRVAWYRTIGARVEARATTDHTTFAVTGLALFGDWHVWNLGWTVVQGRYPRWLEHSNRDDWAKKKRVSTKPPSAMSVVVRRLSGRSMEPDESLFAGHQLEKYRQGSYQPSNSTLIVSGNFEVDAMRSEIESLFGHWKSGAPKPVTVAPEHVVYAPSYIAIPVDDAPTLALAIAYAPSIESPRSEQAARDVLNAILNDRLRVIREGLGVSYGVYAHVSTTAVLIGGDVEPAYAADAARAFVQEIEHLRTGYPELAADFARARKRTLARALADPIGASERASELEQIAIDHAPLDQPDRDLEAIRTLDLAAVQKLAARELQPDRMIAAFHGPPAAIDAAIAAMGIDRSKVEIEKPKDRKPGTATGRETTPRP